MKREHLPPPAHELVPDHALVRWFERVCGFPMEAYRAQLAAQVGPIAASGCVTYRSTEGTYCFRHGVLTTVLSPEQRDIRATARETHEQKRMHEGKR